jgi:Cys-rich repeat protein
VILRVYGFAGAENAYGLDVAVEGCEAAACVDDAFEDDDALDAAAAIAPGDYAGLAVCGGDDDWYAVEVCAGGVVNAQTTFRHALGDVDVALLDAAGQVVDVSAGIGDAEAVRAQAAAAGTMYVQVYGYDGAQNAYALSLTVDGCGECAADADCGDGEICVEGACVAAPVADGTCGAPFVVDAFGPFEGTTSGREGAYGGRCGGGPASGESVWAMAFDGAGTVCVSLEGSAYDTVLHVRTGCDDPASEIACNDDDFAVTGGLQSALSLDVAADQTYFLFVDGYTGADGEVNEGDYVLNVAPGPCAALCEVDADCGDGEVCVEGRCAEAPGCVEDADCGAGQVCLFGQCFAAQADGTCDAPFPILDYGPIEGSVAAGPSAIAAGCGLGARGAEAVYAMAFDGSGEVCVSTIGSSYDTVLHVRTACEDPAAEVACNDDEPDSTASALTLQVVADQTYFVVVDAYARDGGGDYVLDVQPGACP